MRASERDIYVGEVAELHAVQVSAVATTSLQGAIERNSARTTEALAGALIDRGTAEPDAHVAAAAVIAGLSRALLDWARVPGADLEDRKSTRLNSSHVAISYAVSCLKKKTSTHSR